MKPERLEFLDVEWWYVSRRYETEVAAAADWRRLEAEAYRVKGRHDVGFYRHGGREGDPRYIVAVGRKRAGVLACCRILGGEHHPLERWQVEAFIARRIRRVVELDRAGATSGAYVTRRGRRGGLLHPDGTIDERIGGDQ